MRVRNVHERLLPASVAEVGDLVAHVAEIGTRLWPRQWPRMKLDRPLAVGAVGGHGPIRYVVEEHVPDVRTTFRFTAPRGFDGTHGFEIEPRGEHTLLRHVLVMEVHGLARLQWSLAFRPLHDALIEDGLDTAERTLTGTVARPAHWSAWVQALRAGLRRVDSRSAA